MRRYLFVSILLVLSAAFAQINLQSTIPGDGLQWETNELNLAISVTETSFVTLDVYSPGFDPEDYRSDEELGDERYDKNEGQVSASFTLSKNGTTLTTASFGVEPHRTTRLFEGTLEPGEYTLNSAFSGLAKNTFVYTLQADPESALFVELLETQLYNVTRGSFTKAFTVEVPADEVPVMLELYDGDGPQELSARVLEPDGDYRRILVSEDKAWRGFELDKPGQYVFEFLVPDTAYQFTNTIGMRTDKRLRVEGDVFVAISPKPRFELTKTVDNTHVMAGDMVMFSITVRNTGGAIGTATLTDVLPEGLIGEGLNEVITLPAGATQSFTLPAMVADDVSGTLINTAQLSNDTTDLIAQASLQVTPAPALPAEFTITKEVTPDVARVGDEITYTLTISNHGGSAGTVALADVLPRGLEGTFDTQRVTLEAGETRVVEVTGVVQADAPELLINHAAIADTGFNTQLARADVRVERDPAAFTLTKTTPQDVVRAGDNIRWLLTVTNTGEQAGEVTLHDELPDVLTGDDVLETFTLDAGQSRVVAINSRINPEAVPEDVMNGERALMIRNEARIISDAGEVMASASVTLQEPAPAPEPTPEVTPEPEPEPVVTPQPLPEFQASRFSRIDLYYQTSNILSCELGAFAPNETKTVGFSYYQNAPQPVTFQRSVTNGLSAQALEATLDPETGMTSYRVRVTNTTSESVTNAVLTEPLPAGASLSGASYTCSDLSADATQVLLTHTPPANSTYETNSSLFMGDALDEPFVDANGRLYYVLPFTSSGRVSYLVQHDAPLAAVEPPTLTVRTAEREVFLVGETSFMNVPDATRMMASLPVVNPDAMIQVRPLNAVADAKNPLSFEVRVADTNAAYLSVRSSIEPLTPDAEPLVSGYQLALTDGTGVLTLKPINSSDTLDLSLYLEDDTRTIREDVSVFIPGATKRLVQYQLSATVTTAGGVDVEGEARAYAEVPFGRGSVQAALDVGATIEDGIDTNRGLADESDPTDRFALTGAGEEAEPALRSDDGIAIKYADETISAGYYADPLNVPAIEGLPRATALQVETNKGVNAKGFIAVVPRSSSTRVITPDGTRSYVIGEKVARSSERLTLLMGEGDGVIELQLERLKDYTIDYTTGIVTLAEPLWRFDAQGNLIRLRVDYAPEGSPRDALAYGAGVSYTTGDLTFEVGVAQVDYLRIGAGVRYDTDAFSAAVSYRIDWTDGNDSSSQIAVKASGTQGNLTFKADMTFDRQLRGNGRVSYRVLQNGQIALEHKGSVSTNRTALRYEHTLADALTLGAGLDYTWENATFGASALIAYMQDTYGVRLDHSQPFDSNERSKSTLEASYDLNDNLSISAGVAYEWGNELEGSLKLTDTPSGANFSVTYQLPTIAGDNNRARFGIEAPWALSNKLELNFSAGYEADFVNDTGLTAFSIAARYSVPTFTATIATDIALPDNGDTKVIIRAGASGQLSKDQTLSADLNYQVSPEQTGTFGVAYALKLRDLNFLTYHKLEQTTDTTILRGEVAPTYYPSNRLQLRPNLAYRMNLNDSDVNTYQASLFGMYYFDVRLSRNADADPTFIPYDASYAPTFGIGAGAVYLLQPGTDSSDLGFNIEASAQILEPLWFTVGYMLDQNFGGLTPETTGGLYFRLDLVGGSY